MAVYTPVSEDALIEYLKLYDIGTLQQLVPIAEGVENTNYKLETTAGHFILTLFEKRTENQTCRFLWT